MLVWKMMFLFQEARILRLIFRGCAHCLLDCIRTSCLYSIGWWMVGFENNQNQNNMHPHDPDNTCPPQKKNTKITIEDSNFALEGGKLPNPSWKLAPPLFCPTNILGGCFPKIFRKHQKPIHHSECIDQPACPSPTPELPSSSLQASTPTSARAHARPRPARHFVRLRGQRDHGESYPGGPWKSDRRCGWLFPGEKSVKIPMDVEILNATQKKRWWFWAIVSIPYPY